MDEKHNTAERNRERDGWMDSLKSYFEAFFAIKTIAVVPTVYISTLRRQKGRKKLNEKEMKSTQKIHNAI